LKKSAGVSIQIHIFSFQSDGDDSLSAKIDEALEKLLKK
jgi:hypothetical protein